MWRALFPMQRPFVTVQGLHLCNAENTFLSFRSPFEVHCFAIQRLCCRNTKNTIIMQRTCCHVENTTVIQKKKHCCHEDNISLSCGEHLLPYREHVRAMRRFLCSKAENTFVMQRSLHPYVENILLLCWEHYCHVEKTCCHEEYTLVMCDVAGTPTLLRRQLISLMHKPFTCVASVQYVIW